MIEIYKTPCFNKEDVLEMIGQHLSGTCMNSVDQCFKNVEYLKGIKEFNITKDDVYEYFAGEGIYKCESCGWWTYAGEGNGIDCDDCLGDKNVESEDY